MLLEPVKVDKPSGYLHVDRPHKFSSLCPTIYGFIPQTLSGPKVAARCQAATKLKDIKGFCAGCTHPRFDDAGASVLFDVSNAQVRPIGGFRMIDKGEADDKILAILQGDAMMSTWNDIHDVPASLLSMIKHYFITYKQDPDAGKKIEVTIPEIYGREEAYAVWVVCLIGSQVIKASMDDYADQYKSLKEDFADALVDHLKSDLAATLLTGSSKQIQAKL